MINLFNRMDFMNVFCAHAVAPPAHLTGGIVTNILDQLPYCKLAVGWLTLGYFTCSVSLIYLYPPHVN